jgi:proliferating cell nuclear antigen
MEANESAQEGENKVEGLTKLRARIGREMLVPFITVLNTLNDESFVLVSDRGLYVKAVDPAHVAMVEARLSPESFEEFEVEGAGLIGIDTDKVKGVLKYAEKGDVIGIELVPVAKVLRMTVRGLTRSIPLCDPAGYSEPKVPTLHLPASVGLPSKELNKALKQCATVSDHVQIKAQGHSLSIRAENDSEATDLTLPERNNVDVEGEGKSLFPLDYLGNIGKAMATFPEVRMGLGDDFPMSLSGSRKGMEVTFLLAPRIESD